MIVKPRHRISFVLTGGGHAFEALALVRGLIDHVEPSYIIVRSSKLTRDKIEFPGPFFIVSESFAGVRQKDIVHMACDCVFFLKAVVESIVGLSRLRSDAVLSVGSGAAVAPLVAAKLLGIKVIFVESACRLETRSLSGNIAYRLLADIFFVQWSRQKRLYPRAVYAGRPF